MRILTAPDERVRRRACAVRPLTALLLLLALAACGRGDRPADPVLEGVPVSDELRRALEADAKGGRGEARYVAALALHDQLTVDIQRPQTRQAAGDSLYAAWRREPANFLFINLGAGYNYLLRRNADRNAMYALPALADTTTAVGAYVYGRRFYGYGSDGTPYERAWARRTGLDPLQRAWLARSVAEVRGDKGDAVGAVRLLLAELPAARAVGGDRLAAEYWLGVAMRLRDDDRLDDALHAVVRAEGLAGGSGARYVALLFRRYRADILAVRQEAVAARAEYRYLVDRAYESGFSWLATSGLGELASLLASNGDLRGALEVDRENASHCLAAGDSINAPRCLMNVAHDHLMLGAPDSCLTYQRHARTLVEAFGDKRNLAALPAMEAEYFLQVGDFATADSLLALASERSGQTGRALDEAEILIAQIRRGLETRRTDVAYRALARLEHLAPVLRDRSVHQNLHADLHLATADFLARQGEYVRAAEALVRARDAVLSQGGEGKRWEYHRSVGELAERRGDLATAADAFAAARALADSSAARSQEAAARLALASVRLQQGRPADAMALLDDADATGGFGGTFSSRLALRQLLGRAQRMIGDLATSEATLRAAVALATPRTPAHVIGRLHLELGLTLAARGRTAQAAACYDDATGFAAPAGDHEIDRSLQRDLFEAACALAVAADADPRSADARPASGRALKLAARLGGLLPEAEAGVPQIAYFLGSQQAFCWLVDGRAPTLSPLPPVADLERLCRTVLAEYQAVHRSPDDRAARELATILLGPALGAWPEGGSLRIIPDGILSLLPWAALPVPGGDGALVVDRGPIAMGVLQAGRRRTVAAADGPAALLSLGYDGNSEAGGEPRLRAAEREARSVCAGWEHGPAEARTGAEAAWTTSLAAQLARYAIIHVASHAVVYRGDPSGAVLRLAGPGDASPVTIDVVEALDLRAQLVYLSCCEAAGGRADAANGAADFTGAFLRAGADAVVATPVRIDDGAAEAMALAFYRHWRPGSDVAVALRAAMLASRGDPLFSHPGSWAFLRVVTAS
ncbi:MAG: CHAT domain-containing protein [bacterium]|nr:CHAT domain-containing protein [bacterium]